MTLASPRAYYALAAAYYPALTLVVAAGSLAAGKPVVGSAVLAFLLVTAAAGAAVGALLRQQIAEARGSRVVLVGILSLVLGTPLVVVPELLFDLSGLGLHLDLQQRVIALLVAMVAISLNPVFWVASSGWVLVLRRVTRRGVGPSPLPSPPA